MKGVDTVVDNYSCLANSILSYIIAQPAVNDVCALYNGWSSKEKRSFGYSKTEKAARAIEVIAVLSSHSREDLEVLHKIETDAGTL
jgi:hypothetical protein